MNGLTPIANNAELTRIGIINALQFDWMRMLDSCPKFNDIVVTERDNGGCIVSFDGGLAYDLMSIQGDYSMMASSQYWAMRDRIENLLNMEIEDKNSYSWIVTNKD